MSKVTSRVRSALQRMRVKGVRGEGPVGYLVVATALGMLGAGAAPLMQSTVAPAFTGVVVDVVQGAGDLFA